MRLADANGVAEQCSDLLHRFAGADQVGCETMPQAVDTQTLSVEAGALEGAREPPTTSDTTPVRPAMFARDEERVVRFVLAQTAQDRHEVVANVDAAKPSCFRQPLGDTEGSAHMRILQTAISTVGFRQPASNTDKTTLLDELAAEARRQKCSLLLVPAGFWCVETSPGCVPLVATARKIAKKHKVAIVGGIDVGKRLGKGGITKKMIQQRAIPYFGFAVDSKGKTYGPGGFWRQISSTSKNAVHGAPVNLAARLVGVAGRTIAVVLCGEMHSTYVRDAIGPLRPELVVVAGHAGLGQGLGPSLKAMNSVTGTAVVHTQHLTTYARMHMVTSTGASKPVETGPNQVASSSPIWAAATVRRLDGSASR